MDRRQLIASCQQGDRKALGQLYTHYREKLLGVSRAVVGSQQEAEDIVHDAFLLIMAHIGELRDANGAESWMKTIVHRLSLLHVKQRQRTKDIPLEELPDEDLAAPVRDTPTFEEMMESVERLPEGYREVFRLSVLEGMSHGQIGEILGIEAHSSSSQLFRAKALLRDHLRNVMWALLLLCLPAGWLMWNRLSSDNKRADVSTTPQKQTDKLSATIRKEAQTTTLHAATEKPARTIAKQSPKSQTGRTNISDKSKTTTPTEMPDTVFFRTNEDTASVMDPAIALEAPLNSTPPTTHSTNDIQLSTRDQHPSTESAWMMSLSYSGFGRRDNTALLPYWSGNPVNDEPYDTVVHHKAPISIGIALSKRMGKHFSIGTGLRYTWMESERWEGNSHTYKQQTQRLQYIGIPLQASWYLLDRSRWSFYVSSGIQADVPISAKQRSSYHIGSHFEKEEENDIHMPVDWSWLMSVGAEVRLTPCVSVFAEPSLQYFFSKGSDKQAWRTDHTCSIAVPFGVRLTW